MDRPRPTLRLIEGGAGTRAAPSPLGAALELSALGLGLTLAVALLARLPSWFFELGRTQALYALAFAFYALAVARLPRYAALPHVGWIVLAVAAVTRALLVPLPPSLSGDMFRYLWEGNVIAHGRDPYALSPADPALAFLRDARVWPQINHKELSAIYPPLAQAGYALVAWLSPTVVAMKAWIALHDLALVALLLVWARRRDGSPAGALVYAWNPLVLVHYAGGGHNDVTAMVWLAAAFLLSERRPTLAALALATACLVKLLPVVALPFLARRWPWRARLLAGGLIAAGLAWYWSLTRATYSGLAVYWGTWRNNASVFDVLDRLLGGFGPARAVTLAIVAGVALACLWRVVEASRATRLTLAATLFTSPVLHPWYLGWLLMFEHTRPAWGVLALSLTLMLNYGVLATPAEGRAFHLPPGWRVVEYGVPLAIALVSAWLARRPADGHTP